MEGGKFLEKELSYKVKGCFYAVRNLYGSGLREKFYDQALSEIFIAENVAFVDKPRIPLYSRTTGRIITHCIPDKLVANKIIVEIKAKPFTSHNDSAQIKEYLAIAPFEILYLVNFGEINFDPVRIIQTNDRKPFLRFNKSAISVSPSV